MGCSVSHETTSTSTVSKTVNGETTTTTTTTTTANGVTKEETTGTEASRITHFFICGGFGTHLNLQSAADIGLISAALVEKANVLGNAAVAGAVKLLLDESSWQQAECLASAAKQLNLGGNPKFNENYIEQMLFPEYMMLKYITVRLLPPAVQVTCLTQTVKLF